MLKLPWIFRSRKDIRSLALGFVGEVNAGKTTLANRIGVDFAGKEVGKASPIPHETREVSTLQKVKFDHNGYTLSLDIVDTPGIASSVDYRDFEEHGLSPEEAKQRAVEATQGVVKAIQSLDKLDLAVVVVDAARSPFSQVNWTVIGNLQARKIPLLVVANKCDLKDADPKLVSQAFDSPVIPISALTGEGIDTFYQTLGSQ